MNYASYKDLTDEQRDQVHARFQPLSSWNYQAYGYEIGWDGMILCRKLWVEIDKEPRTLNRQEKSTR